MVKITQGVAVSNMVKSKAKKIIQVPIKKRKLDRRYVEGYRKKPEKLDWAEASVKLFSKRLPY